MLMSGVLGGADEVISIPYTTEKNNTHVNRIANNIHLVLQEESFFHQLNDPAAGSHYIESLTAEICEKSWALFQSIEQEGGYASCMENGTIEKEIEKSNALRIEHYKSGKAALIGENKYTIENPPTAPSTFDNLSKHIAQ